MFRHTAPSDECRSPPDEGPTRTGRAAAGAAIAALRLGADSIACGGPGTSGRIYLDAAPRLGQGKALPSKGLPIDGGRRWPRSPRTKPNCRRPVHHAPGPPGVAPASIFCWRPFRHVRLPEPAARLRSGRRSRHPAAPGTECGASGGPRDALRVRIAAARPTGWLHLRQGPATQPAQSCRYRLNRLHLSSGTGVCWDRPETASEPAPLPDLSPCLELPGIPSVRTAICKVAHRPCRPAGRTMESKRAARPIVPPPAACRVFQAIAGAHYTRWRARMRRAPGQARPTVRSFAASRPERGTERHRTDGGCDEFEMNCG